MMGSTGDLLDELNEADFKKAANRAFELRLAELIEEYIVSVVEKDPLIDTRYINLEGLAKWLRASR